MQGVPAKSESDRLQVSSAWVSIGVGTLIVVLKIFAAWMTDSSALRSDALESVVNVMAAIFALGAIIFAQQPADRGHPYGHGKIEYFSAAFEGGLISLASVLIFIEAGTTLVRGSAPHGLDRGILLNGGAGLLNGVLGLFLVRRGRRLGSSALEADGHHVLSDFWTTIGILVGLLVVSVTGLTWLDPVIALLVGALLLRTGFRLVRSAAAALLDAEDTPLIESLVQNLNKIRTADLVSVHGLRTLRSGRFTHVDIHLVVPEFRDVLTAHTYMEGLETRLLSEGAISGELHAHLDPCRRQYCAECQVEACPIRREPFRARQEFTVETATRFNKDPSHS